MILPDILVPGLDLVLCGTAPSRVSKQAGAYYANPGNLFWRALHEVGLTPMRLAPADYPRVVEFGIGLTDLNKTEWGSDRELSRDGFDVAGLAAKIELYRPKVLAFDSKTAGSAFLGRPVAYGRQPEAPSGTVLWVVPSPSGRARAFWDLGPWRDLADFVRSLRGPASGSPGRDSRAPG
jgi:double-stranded uracil-DNA glycosylase